jgi:hypothetical protein
LSFDESGADRYIEVKTTKLGKETPASVSPNSFNCGNLGANTVTLTVNDGNGNTNTCIATVTVQDNIPPVAQCKNVTVNLNSSGQASVTAAQVDNGSSDNCPVSLSLNNSNFDCSDIGPNTVTLTVTDNSNNQSTCDATITVEDNTRPSITLQPEIFLWPPNHQYAVIPVTDMVANVNDNCGGSGISDVVITHATSDEAEDDPGPDDESTLNDIVIAAGCKSVSLRRERMEGGNGRVYNVHLSLTDLGGNTVTAQFKVKVKNNNSTELPSKMPLCTVKIVRFPCWQRRSAGKRMFFSQHKIQKVLWFPTTRPILKSPLLSKSNSLKAVLVSTILPEGY